MSFDDSVLVKRAIIKDGWLHFVVAAKNGQETPVTAGLIEDQVKSLLRVKSLGKQSIAFINEKMAKKPVTLSRRHIVEQDFTPILEHLSPYKRKKPTFPKKVTT